MNRIAVAAAGLLLCTGADEAPKTPDIFTSPAWIGGPNPAQMLRFFPKGAAAEGIVGRSVLECVNTPEGLMSACRVVSETPEGYGFGVAALAAAPLFKMRPATRNGVPRSAKVRLPIVFAEPDNRTYRPNRRFVGDPVWEAAPTSAEVAAAAPQNAGLSGQVVLDCTVDAGGLLRNCSVLSESPEGAGFGDAALVVSRKFRMSRTLEDGRPTSGAPTRLAVSFEKDAAAPTLTHPRWIRTPAAEELAAAFPQAAREAKISSGRGVVDCKVQVGGGFGDCVVASEEPAGLGFGAAALKLAPAFALSSWTEDGRPLDGARLQLPIRFVDETASTASPTKP